MESAHPEVNESHGLAAYAENKEKNGRATYEDAITQCGYGKFHYLLILAMVPATSAQIYSSVTMAYVIPIAECDLKLTNQHKGALNASVFIGLTVGAFFGGFASDIFGRRKLLILGYSTAFVCNVLDSFAHNFWVLFLLRICSGVSMTGPSASIISYCAETHNNERRPRIIMINGGLGALAQGVQPVLAYYLIPMDFRIELIPGVLDYTSWRLFVLVSALPALVAALAFILFPESPKFLMSKGRTSEAIASFQRIYSINTGKPHRTFPIYDLEVPEKQTKQGSSEGVGKAISKGLKEIRPMFRPPYLNTALIVFAISACTMIAMNTVRLWVPQLFATLNEAEHLNTIGVNTICGMIGSAVKAAVPLKSNLTDEVRICPPISADVYLRSFVISATAAISYLITTPVIGWIGKRTFAKLCFPIGAALAISINYAPNKDVFMGLLAAYTAVIRNAFSVMSTITVDLFPTPFRSVAMSMTQLCGRLASMTGNLVFPTMLNLGCSVVFLSLGGILVVGSALVWFVSNRTESL